ncbi:lysozyme inhibitor LprI family protein [Psychrobium sp. nBUS_13]|uniref:lysozyme inhibitor LprI family protein n=1 Tax=Psychrobium sp. nBUS_13 TaxID=3395319 RepID=UPI003EC10035
MNKLKLLLTSSLLSLMATPSAFADEYNPCSSSGSGMQRLECLEKEYRIQDKGLNKIYRKIHTLLDKHLDAKIDGSFEFSAASKKRLIKAQRAWIKFRDSNCEYIMGDHPGIGSGWSIGLAYCLSEMTKERNDELTVDYNLSRESSMQSYPEIWQ